MADITTTSSSGAPAWLQPYQAGYLQQAQKVANNPYQQYGGSLISGFNNYQTQGLDAQAQRGMSGSPLMSTANQALQDRFSGQGQGASQNQYGPISAPAGGANITPGQNQFGAGNPYLQQNIDLSQGDMVRQYNNVQKPAWDTSMQRSGSFGNEGVATANQLAQSDLQRNLGAVSSGMRMQDYTQQQQLAEAGLNRGMAAQQFNSGLGEAAAGRNMQAQQFNAQQGQDYAQRNDAMYNANQGRGMQALGLAPGFANQDYNDINAVTQAGNAYQQQDQRGLDSGYQQFLQARDYPKQQLDVMGRALQQSYGTNTTNTQPGPSGASQLFGGAITGAGLYNLMFGKP